MEAIKQQLQGSHGIGYYSSIMHAPMFLCNLIMRGNGNVDEQAATVLESRCTLDSRGNKSFPVVNLVLILFFLFITS
jgi:hypothetical protein